MRPYAVAGALVLASAAHASYDAITTPSYAVCIPNTVRVTVTATVDLITGAEIGKSKPGAGDGHYVGGDEYVGVVDAGHLTVSGKKNYGAGSWNEGADPVTSATKGAYEHGNGYGHVHGEPATSTKSSSKGYGAGDWDDQPGAVASTKGYGYGQGDDGNESHSPHQTSSTTGGNAAQSTASVRSSHGPNDGNHDHADVGHTSSATFHSFHFSQWSNSSTSDRHGSSAASTRSSVTLSANAGPIASSSSHSVSGSSGSVSSSGSSSASSGSVVSSPLAASHSSSASTSSPSASTSTGTSSSSSSSTKDSSSSSSSSSSSATSSLSSSQASSSSSVTSFSSSSSSTISSATSSASAVCVPDGGSICLTDANCCNAASQSTCQLGTCQPCIPFGNQLVNGGFASSDLAPWTSSTSGSGPDVAGVVATASQDGDGYSYRVGWSNLGDQASSLTLQQTVNIPSGTTVSCDAFVMNQRTDGVGSWFSLRIDGVRCLFRQISATNVWTQLGPGTAVLVGDTHTVELELNSQGTNGGGVQQLFVDNISIIPVAGPLTRPICTDPNPDPPVCVRAGDAVVNGGFSDGTIAPFTVLEIVGAGLIASGVETDPANSQDNDGRFYSAILGADNVGSGIALSQSNIQIPSGTTVNCVARVRHERADGRASVFALFLDGQACGSETFEVPGAVTDWTEYGGLVVVDGDVHTIEIALNSGVVEGFDEAILSIDNLEVTPITAPAGTLFCLDPPPTCLNDGLSGCLVDSDCCSADQSSTCVAGTCTACFTPANVLFNPSFETGLFRPWGWTIDRGGPRGDDNPSVVQGQSQDADGFSLFFPVSEPGNIYLLQQFSLPAGSEVDCSAFVRDTGIATNEYILSVGDDVCATRGSSPGVWGEISGSVVLTADAFSVTIEFISDDESGTDTQEIDNVQIVLTSSVNGAPTCPAP